jgi:hypothetical protein
MPDNTALINRLLGSYLVRGKTYPKPLPSELQEWYCYTSDGGHSVMAAIKSLHSENGSPEEFLVPVPVKAVERVGYAVDHGYVVVDLPYSREIGLVTKADDDEF